MQQSILTLDLRQAPLLLLCVLSHPPQVVQLCLQELTLPCSLQPQVALLCKLRLQLTDTPPQRLTQTTALTRDGEMRQKRRDRYRVGERPFHVVLWILYRFLCVKRDICKMFTSSLKDSSSSLRAWISLVSCSIRRSLMGADKISIKNKISISIESIFKGEFNQIQVKSFVCF